MDRFTLQELFRSRVKIDLSTLYTPPTTAPIFRYILKGKLMKRITEGTTILILVLLFSLACQLPGATLGTQTGTLTAPPPPSTAALITGASPRTPGSENPAGAVFELITPEPLCATVTADEALHLRAEPSEKAEHIQYLHNGEQVTVLNLAGRWWKVQTATGRTGYANSRYLQEEKCK